MFCNILINNVFIPFNKDWSYQGVHIFGERVHIFGVKG